MPTVWHEQDGWAGWTHVPASPPSRPLSVRLFMLQCDDPNMLAVVMGLCAAFAWGIADILTRFTGRMLGSQGSLLAAMSTSLAAVSLWLVLAEERGPWPISGYTLLSCSLAALATLLLYEAMRRGPLSLASPAVSSYPAWAALFSWLLLDVVPSGWGWGAIAMTMAGVFLLAHATPDPEQHDSPAHDRLTLPLALMAGLLYGAAVTLSQNFALPQDGMIRLLWWGRVLGIGLALPLLLWGPRPPRPSWRGVGLAGLQGGLDAAGLVAVVLAGQGMDGTIALVVSSSFTVVTVGLARIVFREKITPGQGLGILLVCSGIAILGIVSASGPAGGSP